MTDPIQADPIKAAMIRTLMLQIPSQTGAGLVVVAYMVGTAWAFSSTVSVVAWGAVALCYVGARFSISRAFVRSHPPSPRPSPPWGEGDSLGFFVWLPLP